MAEIKPPEYRGRSDPNAVRESMEFFFENLDDPEIIFNRVWFHCNSVNPDFSVIKTRSKNQENDDYVDNELKGPSFSKGLRGISKPK